MCFCFVRSFHRAAAQAGAAGLAGVKWGDWETRWIMVGDERSEAGWIRGFYFNGINTL